MTATNQKAAQHKPISKTEESAKRKAILGAAAKTFLAKGYVGTSMELVAAECGAGRRTVYNQFESKKALFDATVEFLWDAMEINKTIRQIGSGSSTEQALSDIGNAIADFWEPEETVAFAKMVISESINFPELGRSYFASGRDPARLAITEYFQLLHATKALAISDPDLAAAQFPRAHP